LFEAKISTYRLLPSPGLLLQIFSCPDHSKDPPDREGVLDKMALQSQPWKARVAITTPPAAGEETVATA
jgi:hypothetical protein